MLTQGYFTILDDEDYEKLRWFTWRIYRKNYKGSWLCYVGRREKGKMELMHRIILQPEPGLVVDHINGNGLDNRRSNIRICTQSQNMKNRKVTRRSNSGYHGVRRCRGRWLASIKIDGRNTRIGWFDDPMQAAKAFDDSATKHFGQYARLNFPEKNNVSR